jgi:hypothetical protein
VALVKKLRGGPWSERKVGTWSQHLEEDRALVGHPRKDLGRQQRRFGRVEPTKVQQVQLTILVSYVDTSQAHHNEPACA